MHQRNQFSPLKISKAVQFYTYSAFEHSERAIKYACVIGNGD
jgi:hypothetical protein